MPLEPGKPILAGQSASSGGPIDEEALEVRDEFVGGNRITLLHDGREAYPAMLAAIAAARQTVHLETYILKSDKTGWKFAKALAERARAAVHVRVIYDSLGSLDLSAEYLQFLRNNGIAVLEYRPVAPWRRRWGWGRRNHRKILVVDGKVGFTGGINISDEFADPQEGGEGWRDTDVRIEGLAAYELDHLFCKTWRRETGKWIDTPEPATPLAGQGGPSLVMVAANDEFLHRYRIRRAYRHALRRAQRFVYIANAYFIPDGSIRQALYKAARRGVDVRILVPGISDVPAVAYASNFLYEEHLRHGVRVYQWPGPVLHAKTVCVDGAWSAVGSYNMDHRSLLHNLEVNLHISDAAFGSEMKSTFERDISRSHEIKLEDWLDRPLKQKMLESLFYTIRYWL